MHSFGSVIAVMGIEIGYTRRQQTTNGHVFNMFKGDGETVKNFRI